MMPLMQIAIISLAKVDITCVRPGAANWIGYTPQRLQDKK